YICYDNEAYMNTGVQRSSATPPSARTATTMPVGDHPGADWGKGKDVPLIAMAHGIPYVATATIADLRDLEQKVTKAMSYHGARYIQILVPCPLGWGLASGLSVTAARLAMETGFYPVFEAEYGKVTSVRKIRAKQPVTNYLKIQRRYAHLLKKNADPNTVARLQAMCDQNIKDFGLLGDDQPELNPTAIQAYERSQAV
ncbi:MAG: thiamine pyrophosphate-dependent enzyme, partial [Succinivibrio sp.]